jgi:hypothetical protein
LKNSTRKLCRQLKDQPDVPGNQKLIKNYKTDVTVMMEELMNEAAENQSFSNFRNEVTNGLNNQEEYEVLQNLKKNLNNDIIKINEDLKNKQDEFAKEA